MKMVDEFKAFIMRGNVVDLAVGVIIGAAFGKIVTSLVNDILMPVVGILVGGVNFTNLSFTLVEATATSPGVLIKYGNFLQTLIDFLIVGFTIFMAVKAMNSVMKKKQAEAEAPSAAPTVDQSLLMEIRDLLKNK